MRLFFAVVVAKITFSADKYLIINKIIIIILHGKVLSTELSDPLLKREIVVNSSKRFSQQSHLSVTFMSLMLKSRIVDKTTKGCESSNAIVSLSKESVVNLQ